MYALLLLLPGESYGKVGEVETITLNAWRGSLFLIAFGSSLVAVCASLWAAIARRLRVGWALLPLGLGSPLLCCMNVVDDLGAHQDAGSVRDRDGAEYHLLKSAFLQGSHLAIARVRRRFGPTVEYEVLVESPWEASFGCLAIVRPEGQKDAEIYLTEGRTLVGVPYESTAYLAYDLDAKRAYSQIYNVNENGYADLRKRSPFLLLGADDAPRKDDFEALLKAEDYARPTKTAVEAELSNPNPRVAALAKRYLEGQKVKGEKR